MKAAAKKSYLKKGEAVVEMNYKAIDAGVDAIVKINVPESWKSLSVKSEVREVKSKSPEMVKFVKEVLQPVGMMQGDSLPVSVFEDRCGRYVPARFRCI